MLSARLRCRAHRSVIHVCLPEDTLWFVSTALTLSVCVGDKQSISSGRRTQEIFSGQTLFPFKSQIPESFFLLNVGKAQPALCTLMNCPADVGDRQDRDLSLSKSFTDLPEAL